jgi:hypothetical protein
MLPITAMAKSETIEVNYANVKISLDDELKNTVYDPIIYNGSTYLPYQAIAYIFRLDYAIDNEAICLTNKVSPQTTVRKDQTTEKYGVERIAVECKEYDVFVNDVAIEIEAFKYNGFLYLQIRPIADALDIEIEWDEENSVIYAETDLYKRSKEIAERRIRIREGTEYMQALFGLHIFIPISQFLAEFVIGCWG